LGLGESKVSLTINVHHQNVTLSEAEDDRLRRQLATLDKRLIHHPSPLAELTISHLSGPAHFEVDLRVQLAPLGAHLISHQTGATPHRAVRLAINDILRQIEREHAKQRGEPSFGVPSRRRV
jgi:ribosome-associated translation inhibitor RaiA